MAAVVAVTHVLVCRHGEEHADQEHSYRLCLCSLWGGVCVLHNARAQGVFQLEEQCTATYAHAQYTASTSALFVLNRGHHIRHTYAF